MKDIVYRCDICHASCLPDAVETSLIGLFWSDFPVPGWIAKSAHQTERHICTTCLKSLQVLGDNKKPAKEDK